MKCAHNLYKTVIIFICSHKRKSCVVLTICILFYLVNKNNDKLDNKKEGRWLSRIKNKDKYAVYKNQNLGLSFRYDDKERAIEEGVIHSPKRNDEILKKSALTNKIDDDFQKIEGKRDNFDNEYFDSLNEIETVKTAKFHDERNVKFEYKKLTDEIVNDNKVEHFQIDTPPNDDKEFSNGDKDLEDTGAETRFQALITKYNVDLNQRLAENLSPWEIAKDWTDKHLIIAPDSSSNLGKSFVLHAL